MTQTYQEKILSAFWHKSRRTFVSCTASDVVARSGLAMGKVTNHLVDMNRRSLVEAESVNGYHIYDLTEKGRSVFLGNPLPKDDKHPKQYERSTASLQQHNAKRRLSAEARKRKIIAMLSKQEMTVEQLADALGITQSPPNNLRKILRELRECGSAVNRVERNGRAHINHWMAA